MKAHKVMLKTTDVRNCAYVKIRKNENQELRNKIFIIVNNEISPIERSIDVSIRYGILDDKDLYK